MIIGKSFQHHAQYAVAIAHLAHVQQLIPQMVYFLDKYIRFLPFRNDQLGEVSFQYTPTLTSGIFIFINQNHPEY